ncbi:MAG: ATP-binding protein [Pseudomonadota bacterium]
MGIYFYAFWIPTSVHFSTQQSLKLLSHTLEIVKDQITPDLIKDDLTSVQQNLDIILLKNPDWRQLVLTDRNGNTIYPANGGKELEENGLLTVSLDITAYGEYIGELRLWYDFSTSQALIRDHSTALFFLILLILALFIAVAAAIIQHFVIKPASLLTQAAESFTGKASETPEDMPLPPQNSDEIGRLTRSFAAMQHAITSQQQGMEIQNQALLLAKEYAENANQTKSEFLANMSHELRTPLNSILGLTRMLTEDEGLSEENQSMARTLNRASKNLLEIVDDILDISKIEAGNMVLEKIGFDFKNTVINLMETLAPIASGKGVSLQYNFEDDNYPYVLGDSLRISRILSNLVSNAIKYTDTGTVEVSISHTPVSKDEIEIQCLVHDTGIGIPEDKQEVIFDKFTQADESTTRKFGGTGLGLAITKDLVEMMGGTISLRSVVDEGSTFKVILPFKTTQIIDDDVPQKARQARAKRAIISNEKIIPVEDAHVLVAEDHLLNQDFIQRLLTSMGFKNIDIVENGVLAIEALTHTQYDLILMDCHMPEKNGYQTTQEIRASEKQTDKHVPIIALTADAMKGTQEKCYEAGMDEYLSKPIDASLLKKLMQQWIAFPASKKEKTTAAPKEKKKAQEKEKNQLVDLSLLESYATTPEELAEFIAVFRRQSEESLAILTAQAKAEDPVEWQEAAHKFKGGAALIGAQDLSTLCARAQAASDIKDRQSLLKKIQTEYKKVMETLHEAT